MKKLLLLFLISFSLAAQQRQKVIFDCDLGDDIDDAYALGYLLTLQDRYEIPAFVQADAYVTLRINRVRLFFKMQNVSQGLLNSNYYTAYLHPAMARSFGYGVRWLLFD